MTDRTWIGGGSNNAASPQDWSPTGAPQPGDTLRMLTGAMNLFGGDLAGDTLNAGNTSPQTMTRPVINMYSGASLNLRGFYTGPIVNVYGHDTLNLYAFQGLTTVNLNVGSVLSGNLVSTFGGAITVRGPGVVNADGVVGESGGATTVDAAVIGDHTWNSAGKLDFGGFVGGGITANLSYLGASVTIDHPDQFHGQITDTVNYSVHAAEQESVVLKGITATDYTYHNDRLSLFDHGRLLDELQVQTPHALTVTQTGLDVTVWTGGAARQGMSISQQSPPAGSVHSALAGFRLG